MTLENNAKLTENGGESTVVVFFGGVGVGGGTPDAG